MPNLDISVAIPKPASCSCSTVRVTIVLPCRDEALFIEKCVRSIFSQTSVDGRCELIVADGLSGDGTYEIIQGIQALTAHAQAASNTPVLRLIRNPGRIASTGLNAAIRAAHGEIVIRMDAHTEYAADYVSRCVEVLESSCADNVGGPALTKPGNYLETAVAAAYQSPFSVGGARFHDPDYEGWVDTVTYGCWRRETFDRFGYFDEELVRNQDDEHNLRIIRGGGKIYQSPKIKSWYKPRSSLAALFKQYMQYGYWKVRVIQKHKLPASWRHLVPGAFLLTLIALFLLSTFSFLFSTLVPTSDLRPPTSGIPYLCFLLSTFCFCSTVSAYLLTICAASIHTAAKTEWKLFPALLVVFPCYHFGYGYGFLRGVWDFLIRRKHSNARFAALTR